jgi:peptide/nickel transport system substrate-binding protein
LGLLLSLVLLLRSATACVSTKPTQFTGSQAEAVETAVTLTLPGDDWGYPSPFAFYPRGPGYVQMSLLFDPLTWKDEEGVIPWLADEWTVSDDGTEWTFTLHPDVAWHDGAPLTAEDVAFSFEYFKAHHESFKWSWPVDKVVGTEVLDEQTVSLTLSEPVASCHEVLVGSLPIIPRHVWTDVDDPARLIGEKAVVGSGPFKLTEYSKEEGRYVYTANPDYFKGRPLVAPLIFVKVENQALALKTHTTDYASFWGKEIEAMKEFEGDSSYGIIEGPSYWVLQLIFNTTRPPLDDVRFRQAIAHAVDREKIVEQVTHGGAIVASLGILPPGTDWHNPALPSYTYDPAKTERILDELEVSDPHLTLITTADFVREAELIQSDLAQIGLQVDVQTGDNGTVDGLLREGSFDLAINGHGGLANPAILESPTWPAASYQNDTYDRLYREQARGVDDAARRETVWQLQEIIADELPVLTLWHPRMWTVYDPAKLDGWFYTEGGIGFGIPISMNKLTFIER